MKAPSSVCVLIAAYNEAAVIGQVITGCQSCGYTQIVVVDDGSTDNTVAVAKKAGALTISLPLNCGKSAAISTGLHYLQRSATPPSVVVCMDADGQHLANEIGLLVAPIYNSQRADLVCGIRKLHTNTPLINRFGRLVGDITTWLYTGVFFVDSQCGFRAIRLRSVEGFDGGSGKYAIETRLLDFALKNHLKIASVPVSNIYTSYSSSKAHKQGLLRGIETLVSLLK